MFTRCPACQTVFRVRADTLRAARGQVRCGRCDAQFDALDSLAETAEELDDVAPTGASTTADASLETAQPEQAVAADVLAAESPGAASPPGEAATGGEPERTPPLLSAVDAAGLDPAAIQALLLHEDGPASGRWRRRGWAAAGVVLLILLAGQWIHLQRAHFYQHYPQLRPVLQRLCGALDCELPLEHAPARIEVVERLVRAHPRVEQALLVDVTFVSRADHPIAYPVLELRLADLSGNRMAARRFPPAEYLPVASEQRHGLQPGRPVHVTLELVAPQTDVVSFQFEFR